MPCGVLERPRAVCASVRDQSGTSTLALAARLRAMDDENLVAALAMRSIAPAGIRDFFDLADALLTADAIQECLSRLDRRSLGALSALGAASGPGQAGQRMSAQAIDTGLGIAPATLSDLSDLLLLDEDDHGFTSYDEVAQQLQRWPAIGLPNPVSFTDQVPPIEYPRLPATDRPTTDHLAAEHAFSATTATAELLFELEREPARLLARGTIGLPETRRLAQVMAIDDAAVPLLIAAAERAGLVSRETSQLHAADGHADWLGLAASERWLTLAEAWAAGLPIDIRSRLAERPEVLWGDGLRDWLAWLYPGGGDWLRERVDARRQEAERLGITANEVLSSAGAALLAGDAAGAGSLLAAQLPAAVDKVYLQNDLSVVAPGPLEPTIDTRLRTMADVEGRALASSYRMSASSISRAVASGETAESILAFLVEISLTGLPQPLRYLIDETAARHGMLRVGELATGDPPAVSYIRSDDSVLLGAVLIDHSLAVLGLTASDMHQIVSRRDRSQVFWALVEARYPVAAEDSAGRIVSLRRRPPADNAVAEPANPLRVLVERLRLVDAGSPADTGQAWLSRQLEAAIRDKSTLTVSVRMPSGAIVDYRLEPASIAGGRLRARDQVSEIERTLPLSSIAAVQAI